MHNPSVVVTMTDRGPELEVAGIPINLELTPDGFVTATFAPVLEAELRAAGSALLEAADELELRRRGEWPAE